MGRSAYVPTLPFDTPATPSGWSILVNVGSAITSWRATVLAVQANDGAISPASVMPRLRLFATENRSKEGAQSAQSPAIVAWGSFEVPLDSLLPPRQSVAPRIKGIMAAWAGACAVLMLPFDAKWRAALADRVPCGKRRCQTKGGAHVCQNVYHFFG